MKSQVVWNKIKSLSAILMWNFHEIRKESSGSVDQYAAREALSLRSSRPQKQSSSTSASEKSKAPDFNLFQYSESVEKEQAIKKEKEAFDGRMFDGACHRPQIDFNQAPSTSISPTPSPDLNCYPSAHPPPPISVHSKSIFFHRFRISLLFFTICFLSFILLRW